MRNLFPWGAVSPRPSRGKPDARHPGWPEVTPTVVLRNGGRVRLRPLRLADGEDWREMRLLDERYLRPVEPTLAAGWEPNHTRTSWWNYYLSLVRQAREGVAIPMAIELNGRFVGEITLDGVRRGYIDECQVGYWVFSSYTGQGLATAACALATDHAMMRLGVHRVAATWLPSNEASGAVLHHCGYRDEGLLRKALHIDGRWRDHHFSAIVRGDNPEGSCVGRLREGCRLR